MTLPPTIHKLLKLTHISLNINKLQALPIEFWKLPNLKSLRINDNMLSILPSNIRQLSKLVELDVSENQLSQLPKELGFLSNLKKLWVGRNLLKIIPAEIGDLSNLEELWLVRNKIAELPSEIGGLVRLKKLWLSNNNIKTLPSELGTLSKLEYLYLEGNPLTILPELIPENGYFSDNLRKYLTDTSKKTDKINEAKMIIVGDGEVGKTSLVKRLIHNTFDAREPKTEGIAIEHWRIGNTKTQVNIWDFGGQEIMHATHQFFLTKRSLYLIVLTSRQTETDNRLDYWLKIIQSLAPNAPIVVVGNKCDQHRLYLNTLGIQRKYPQVVTFVDTSCRTGEGIDELYKIITAEIQKLKHVNARFPLSWKRVKNKLEQDDRDYISEGEFLTICNKYGISEETLQYNLLGLLNDLGTVLNYHDNPRLTETSVLNPKWVTNGVYTILNNENLMKKRSGIVSQIEIIDILSKFPDNKYPPSKCIFIIEMMQKFELCFSASEYLWLIPDLLNKKEPEIDNPNDALHFIYRYPVLPSSIIGRFIVRSQHTIENNLCWRDGVVLASEGNRAIIRADPDLAQIDIRITGEIKGRRRFLSVIRYTFEQIHNSLSGLRNEIKELVPLPEYPSHYVEYDELLGWEKAGMMDYFNGKLQKSFPLQQLLDGYETSIQRQARRVDIAKIDEAEVDHLIALLKTNKAHRMIYETMEAKLGMHTPPYVITEIERLNQEIIRISDELERRGI